MNAIVNKLSLAEDKRMSRIHLKQLGFTYSACELFTENKERQCNLNKQVIQDIFTKTNKIQFGFSMIWLMEILKI